MKPGISEVADVKQHNAITVAWKKHVMDAYIDLLTADESMESLPFSKFLKMYSSNKEENIVPWLETLAHEIQKEFC